jgi:RNA polymerase II subunit A-like phosphatase
VLAGVHILFTGLIPLGQPPEAHALWRMAASFGASCTQEPHAGVTHVVAASLGTKKVFWAQQQGKHVVSKAWCVRPICNLLL